MSGDRRPEPRLHDFRPREDRFLAEVLEGLRQPRKELPCKYLYDERGSRLFDEICDLPEYYPTRTELAIMRRHAPDMADALGPGCLLVEYGSGSSVKTRRLLDHLERPAGYVPIDISGEHLLRAAATLAETYPGLEVLPVCADFTGYYEVPAPSRPARRNAVYFPGSTIGNFGPSEARDLLGRIASTCGPGGALLIGVDLKKDGSVLEPAYDDAQGVTAAFNLNLLRRINRELGGDFRLDCFRHRAFYNADEGRVEMHLISLAPQTVRVGEAEIPFNEGESIRTECSYKYALEDFGALASAAGFDVAAVWTDEARLFSVQYLTAR